MTSLQIESSTRNGYLCIVLPDSINMDSYILIEEKIAQTLSSCSGTVVLDLSQTKSLFSSGLGLLIRIKKKVDEKKGTLAFVNVSKKIREIFTSVHLDRVFDLYATDVEFELAHDMEQQAIKKKSCGFIFVARKEKDVYRIALSGDCGSSQDLSALRAFAPDPRIGCYVFDLTGLDLVDTSGIHILSGIFFAIHKSGATIVTYGGDRFIKDLLEVLTLTEFVKCFANEREALEAIGRAK